MNRVIAKMVVDETGVWDQSTLSLNLGCYPRRTLIEVNYP
jgi:hypothetical protein